MKRIVTAALVLLGGAASAQAPDATDVTRKWEGAKADTKKAAREAERSLTEGKDTYDIKGTVMDRDDDDLTIAREGQPNAKLELRNTTLVYMDGRTITVKEIPPGSNVRAKFQLDGDDTVAVRVDVSPKK